MPYSCALEVCATFCDEISGALIPLFGPTFPSRCASRNNPSFPRMIIDDSIIAAGIADAKEFRAQYSSSTSSVQASPTPSFATPPTPRSNPRSHADDQSPYRSRRTGLKRTFANGSLYNTGTDTDNDSKTSSSDRYIHSPFTPTSVASSCIPKMTIWTPTNGNRASDLSATISTIGTPLPDGPHRYSHKAVLSCGPSPWLSAIPRSSRAIARSSIKNKDELPGDSNRWTKEITAVDGANGEGDEGYDGEASASGSEKSNEQEEEDDREAAPGEPELRAAWVLMQLCVRGKGHNSPRPLGASRGGGGCVIDPEGPKAKRRRASSF